MNNESQPFKSLNISVLIISDTRTASSDKSGKILEDRIKESGHILISKLFVKDEPTLIKEEISKMSWTTVAKKFISVFNQAYKEKNK